jgi:RNA polymerase sigma-70 factor, ECF subfamily
MMRNEVNTLWEAFHQRLHRFILKRVHNPSDADDILQEVFLRIYQHIDTVRARDRLVPWMFQIARNAVTDYYRAASRRQEISLDEEAAFKLNAPLSEAETAFHQELAACLQPMVAALPETYREAVELAELKGFSQRAVAETIGISHSGAKSRVQRGRQKLKEMLLNCCQIQLDTRGNVVDYSLKGALCDVNQPAVPSCC